MPIFIMLMLWPGTHNCNHYWGKYQQQNLCSLVVTVWWALFTTLHNLRAGNRCVCSVPVSTVCSENLSHFSIRINLFDIIDIMHWCHILCVMFIAHTRLSPAFFCHQNSRWHVILLLPPERLCCGIFYWTLFQNPELGRTSLVAPSWFTSLW